MHGVLSRSAPAASRLRGLPAGPQGQLMLRAKHVLLRRRCRRQRQSPCRTLTHLVMLGVLLESAIAANTTATTTPPPGTTPVPRVVTCGFQCLQQAGSWKCNTTCGDGVRAGWEECDDGNEADGDGCSGSCEVEKYFNCSTEGPGGDVPLAEGVQGLLEEGVQGFPVSCLADTCSDRYPGRLKIPEAKEMAHRITSAVAVGIALGVGASLTVKLVDGEPADAAIGRHIFGREGSSALIMLVDQVQFIHIMGNVQGVNHSESTTAFCDGLSWANYNFVIPGFLDNTTAAGAQNNEDETPGDSCTLEVGMEYARCASTCIALFIIVFMVREACGMLYMCCHPDKPQPDDMKFPTWEGPLLLTQFYGIVHVCVRLLVSDCPIWLAVGAFTLSAVGGIVMMVFYRIIRCKMAKGTILWMDSPSKSISEFKEATRSMGVREKLRSSVEWLYACRFEGTWKKTSDSARHWGFILDRVSKMWWTFSAFKLFVKCYAAVAVNVFPGSTGSLMMTVLFFADSLFSILKSPYRDRWQVDFNVYS